MLTPEITGFATFGRGVVTLKGRFTHCWTWFGNPCCPVYVTYASPNVEPAGGTHSPGTRAMHAPRTWYVIWGGGGGGPGPHPPPGAHAPRISSAPAAKTSRPRRRNAKPLSHPITPPTPSIRHSL